MQPYSNFSFFEGDGYFKKALAWIRRCLEFLPIKIIPEKRELFSYFLLFVTNLRITVSFEYMMPVNGN